MIGEQTIGRLKCRMGIHVRSKHKVKLVDSIYRSRCRFCDQPMREDGSGGWMLDDGQPAVKNSGRLLDLD